MISVELMIVVDSKINVVRITDVVVVFPATPGCGLRSHG